MPHLRVNGVDLYYEFHGPEGGELLVLNNGILGYQKHAENVKFGAHTSAVHFSPVDHAMIAVSTALSQVASGKLRALAVLAKERFPDLPDVPTMTEAGFPDVNVSLSSGFFVPAGVIMFLCGRIWDRFEDSPWKEAVQRGLAPLTIGLMLAGTWVLAKTVILGTSTAIIAGVVTAILLSRHVNPALLIFGGGVVGWLLGR